MRMYDFTKLAVAKMDEEGGECSVSADYIDGKMNEVCELFSKEIWEGFFLNGVRKMVLGDRNLCLQHFRTRGINDYLFTYNDKAARVSAMFYLSLLPPVADSTIIRDGKFHVMNVAEMGSTPYLPMKRMPYPFGAKPSRSDLEFMAMAVKDMAKNILELMDSPFKGRE